MAHLSLALCLLKGDWSPEDNINAKPQEHPFLVHNLLAGVSQESVLTTTNLDITKKYFFLFLKWKNFKEACNFSQSNKTKHKGCIPSYISLEITCIGVPVRLILILAHFISVLRTSFFFIVARNYIVCNLLFHPDFSFI